MELARQIARDWRQGDDAAEARLTRILADLPPHESVVLTRAFSAYFGLVNMAEKADRIRARRAIERSGQVLPESFTSALRELNAQGVDAAALAEVLQALDVTPVFTAHPTETVRRTMLRKEQRIADLLLAERSMPRRGSPCCTRRWPMPRAMAAPHTRAMATVVANSHAHWP